MTRREAAVVLASLATAFNHKPASKQEATAEAALWFQAALERCSPEVGQRTAQRVIRDDRWWPTPARFNEVRRLIEAERDTRALPAANESTADWRDGIAKAREALRKARAS